MPRGRLSVEFGPDDVPPFVVAPTWYPAFLDLTLSQFDGLDQAYHVLVNSFRDLEPMDGRWMPAQIWHLRPRHPQGGAVTTPDPSAGVLILLGRTCCLFHVGYMIARESYRMIFLRS